MATNMPVKLVLRGTSNISLNERFEKLPKVNAQQQQQNQNQNASRQRQLQQERIQQQQATAKNRRLAAQMANRPSVKMALGGPGPSTQGGAPRRGRGAFKQGGAAWRGSRQPNNVKSRLTLRGGQRGAGARGRLGGNRGAAARLQTPASDVKGRLGPRRGGARGGSAMAQNSARGGRPVINTVRGRGRGRGRAAAMSGRGAASPRGAGVTRGRGGRGAARGGFRGRGGVVRGRGGARGRGRGAPTSASALDNELDAYMASANMDDQLLM